MARPPAAMCGPCPDAAASSESDHKGGATIYVQCATTPARPPAASPTLSDMLCVDLAHTRMFLNLNGRGGSREEVSALACMVLYIGTLGRYLCRSVMGDGPEINGNSPSSPFYGDIILYLCHLLSHTEKTTQYTSSYELNQQICAKPPGHTFSFH